MSGNLEGEFKRIVEKKVADAVMKLRCPVHHKAPMRKSGALFGSGINFEPCCERLAGLIRNVKV